MRRSCFIPMSILLINLTDRSWSGSQIHFLKSRVRKANGITWNVRVLRMPACELTYQIQVMKIRNYTLEEIFEKKLLFLIPFYIFVHESRFMEYNKDKDKLRKLMQEYEDIKNELEELSRRGEITEYIKCTLLDMSNKVLKHIARNYENIREGVKSVMGGKILEYEAKTILNKSRAEGKSVGKMDAYAEMVREGFISVEDALKRLGISREEFQKFLA